MSKKDKFFTKVKIGTQDIKLTAVNISGKHLITGQSSGELTTYEIGDKKLIEVSQKSLKKNIDKILIPPNKKISFVLCEGEIYFYNLPSLSFSQLLIKDKNYSDIFINLDDPKCDNMLLVLTKRKKIKLYDFEYAPGNVVLTERSKETISIDETPSCAVWTTNNYFIYASGNKTYWVDLNSGKTTIVDFDRTVQLINLDDKIAVSNIEMTLFMKEGSAFTFNPITHIIQNGIEFKGYANFRNHLIALYKNAVHIYKKGEQQYEFVESLEFGQDGNGKYLVTSDYKVIVITETPNVLNVIDFRERPYEEQIKVLIDQKLYNNGLEKLIQNVPEEDENKNKKIEQFFLDCAWGCIEGNKKDFNKAIKYISLTNYNPFEFIYMFFDSLSVNIIHSDKKQSILDHRKENQLLGFDPKKNEEEDAYSYLMNILIMKRNYLLRENKNDSAEVDKSHMKFMSSSRGKINLSDSTTDITLQNTFDAINNKVAVSNPTNSKVEDLVITQKFLDDNKNGTNIGLQYGKAAPILNYTTLGLPLGDMTLITGHSGNGKTSMAFELMILPIAENGLVTIFSNEMGIAAYQNLLLAHILVKDLDYWKLTRKKIKQGKYTEEDEEMLQKAMEISKTKYHIKFVKLFDNDTGVIMKYMKQLARQGCQCFVWDTFKGDDISDGSEAWLQLLMNSRKIFNLVSKLNVALVCTFQLALYTTNQRYLDASCLSSSKQIKEVVSELLMIRRLWADEYTGEKFDCKAYRLDQDKQKQLLQLDSDKTYIVVFINKTRNDESNREILYEWNSRFNKWTELGYCTIRNDHKGG